MVLKDLEKNIRKEKLIIKNMIMIFYMTSMGLIELDLIKMVIIYMDLIKMD